MRIAQGAGLFEVRGRDSVRRMDDKPTLRLFLEPSLRQSAEAGEHNFVGKMISVAKGAGMRVEICGNALADKAEFAGSGEYALCHMEEPLGQGGLVFRRVYYYPFWAIERSEKRWEWDVATARFAPRDVPQKEARGFARNWRKRIFGADVDVGRDGFVYVPLQGMLSKQRSFQTCTPLEMVEQVLEHDKKRAVIAALHPKETYGEQEVAGLERLEAQHPRLTIQMGGMEQLLPRCDYVVTMNSGVGFSGYFLEKPLVLFGKIDFHHIAAKVGDLGAKEAIEMAPELAPDYAAYLWWFWQRMSINAGRPEAEDKIRDRMRAGGFPV